MAHAEIYRNLSMNAFEQENTLINQFLDQIIDPMQANLAHNFPSSDPRFFEFDHIASNLQNERQFKPESRKLIARYLVEKFTHESGRKPEYEEDIRATCLAWVIRDASPDTLRQAKLLGVLLSSEYRSSTVQGWWYIILDQISKVDSDNIPKQNVISEIQKAQYKHEEFDGDIAVLNHIENHFSYAAKNFGCKGIVKILTHSQVKNY
ncbi:MAG: hypothetical protein AAB508_03485 [Patescibacteria group bacterium]